MSNTTEQAMSPIPPPPATVKLDASKGPLVWIDCEMTGLDIDRGDRLLEVACIITDGDLNPVDEGVSYVISTSKEVLDSMNAWCVNQHGLSGLTSACLSSTTSYPHASVRAALLAYMRDRIPVPNAACLAGNTVHADKVFLVKEMPELIQHLHYRIVDVSSIKELVRRWYGSEEGMTWRPRKEGEEKKGDHRALNDIRASIDELKWYREKVFQAPSK
ncbi:Exonuclease, RNase T/DNA polymerase III [Kalmanozyma brasiliensis GHG001]|uniref:Exonuclease domain-containing protein n=1 Tax=Kalmanozyma brasiliensis (strain GHG001) TaxID=1365824 RepID=V5EZM1_KALBG|nr:Exonuclease, RNase T/DNA polymerase III [Kalmanozyma brasiliensis GHG001]EST09378.1 Exonuclease, RNase T/DNA polymerase III [Kalmanozyma brasiliensis GHG001]